jgi:hypothetical protein
MEKVMKKWNQRYHDKFKQHSLINQVWDEKNLENAWKRVKASQTLRRHTQPQQSCGV